MTEDSIPWQAGVGHGAAYSADEYAALVMETLGHRIGANVGVVPGFENELAVTSSGDNALDVQTGRAISGGGRVYKNDAEENLVSADPDTGSGTTGRLVVLRDDWTLRTTALSIISSDDDVTTIPTPTQTIGVTYEIPIASFQINSITGAITQLTDAREFTRGVPYEVIKASDETVNNSDTLQDDDELFAPLGINQTYIFEAMLAFIAASSATPDCKIAFTIPSGTLRWSGIGGSPIGEGTQIASAAQQNFGVTTSQTSIHIRGIVAVGATPGELQLQWAQNVATAEDTDLKANSWLRIRRA